MTQSNITAVVLLLVGCGLLIGGISYWLGPETNTDIAEEEQKLEELVAPLSPDELAAYNVDMTNEKNPVAKFTTNLGVFEIELFEDTMPITAGNFIELAEKDFYNKVKFHRVISDFMIQGGDPNSKTDNALTYGTGGSGKTIPDEHIKGKYLTNIRGTISMANSGPNSGSSQFFINVRDNKSLDFDVPDPNNSAHPVFGQVISGMDIVDKISMVDVNPANNIPLDPVVIESVEILRK